MLVSSASVFPSHSVIISQTKSILGFGTAVKRILFDTISRADAKSINGNGFLSDLANGLNFFSLDGLQVVFSFYHALQKALYQSLGLQFLCAQFLFCMVAINLQN